MLVKWGLSEREAEVLSWLLDGKTGVEISSLLGVSHDTVRKHTSRIYLKESVRTARADRWRARLHRSSMARRCPQIVSIGFRAE